MTTPTPDCLFCKIAQGQIATPLTYRDDEVVAFKDLHPRAPLHQLVIPTRHVPSLATASEDDAPLLGRLMVVAAQLARDAGHADSGFRVVMNAGPDAGQTVFHVHLHVLAGRALDWPPG